MKSIYKTIIFTYPNYYFKEDEQTKYSSVNVFSHLLQDFSADTITKLMCQELRELRIQKGKNMKVQFLSSYLSLQEFS